MGSIDRRVWGVGILWGIFVYSFHKYGAIVGLYLAYPWFQNLTHAASASGVAILLGLAGLHYHLGGRRLLVFVVVGTALGATGWEVIEYLGWMDQFGVYLLFHDLDDAAVDMASNAVGVGAALLALWWRTGLDPAAIRGSSSSR